METLTTDSIQTTPHAAKALPFIYVFSGHSGAGKDCAASILALEVVKFATPGKQALEHMLGLPTGFLDDREAREQIAPDCQGRTYLQVLIDFWKHRDAVIGKDLFPQQVKATLLLRLALGNDVAVTDMRSKEEMLVLADLNHMGYKVVPVWIIGGHRLESDAHSRSLSLELCRRCGYTQPLYVVNSIQVNLDKYRLDLLNKLGLT